MHINPEIRRSWWLEFSPHRLIVMPIVLAAIFFVSMQTHTGVVSQTQALRTMAGFVFFVLVKLWGGYKAAESVIDEVNDNTWDFQKLSALSPWSLTIGKLFGSTSYTWYGGLMAIAVEILASVGEVPALNLWLGVGLVVFSGLTIHAAAILSSLLAIQSGAGARKKLRAMPHLLIGLFVGSMFSGASILNAWIGTQFASDTYNRTIVWHGMAYERLAFLTVTAMVILVWLVAGIYWQMRGQMKIRNGPWLWLSFVLFWMYFISGFTLLPDTLHVTYAFSFQELLAFIASFSCLYFIAFQEQWNVVRYRRVVTAWRAQDYRLFSELCPRWIPTFIICLVTAVGLTLHYGKYPGAAFIFALLCFSIRDIALLHFFKLFPTVRRPYQTTKFYLAVLYLLVPFVLAVSGSKMAVAMFIPWPFGDDNTYVYQGLISGLIQAGIAVAMAIFQWRRYGKQYQ